MRRYIPYSPWRGRELIVFVILVAYVKAEYSHIWKCCFKGEYLHKNGRDCAARDNSVIDPYENAHNESTRDLQSNRASELYWLPPDLWNRNLSVHYASTYSCDKFIGVSFDDENLSFDDDMNIRLQMSTTSENENENENEIVFEPADYCLDAENEHNVTWIVRICMDYLLENTSFMLQDQFRKCCPQGELIKHDKDNVNCTENLRLTISNNSNVKKLNTDIFYRYNSYSLCTRGQFQILKIPNITQRIANVFLERKLFRDNNSYWRYMCMDVGVSGSGAADWTLGYCSFEIPLLFKMSEQTKRALDRMGAPAAVLLALAVAAVLTYPKARASTHSRALVCHAGALCVAHTMQTVHTFTQEHCREFAYAINYFQVAAAAWLQVICFNIAQGFRKILRTKIGDQKSEKKKKFLLFSLYGWGLPSIFTVVILATETDYSFSEPLYHTKTCFYEDGPFSRTSRFNTFFYYYFWMCIILLLNIAMFIYIAVKLRAMRKETSILHRKEDGQSSANAHRSAVVYIKLLMVMGVLEMIVELTAWAVKNSSVPVADGVRITDKTFVYNTFLSREFTYRWTAQFVDLLRAFAIFVVCFFGEAMRKRMRQVMARCLRWLRPLTTPDRQKKGAGTTAAAPDANNTLQDQLDQPIFYRWQLCKSCTRGSEAPETELQGTFTSRTSISTITTSVSSGSRTSSLT